MKKTLKATVLASVCFIAACDDDSQLSGLDGIVKYETKPSVDIFTQKSIQGSDKAAQFVIKCAKAANPMADEEGEDLVAGCIDAAKEIYGKPVYKVSANYPNSHSEAIPCESDSLNKLKICMEDYYSHKSKIAHVSSLNNEPLELKTGQAVNALMELGQKTSTSENAY